MTKIQSEESKSGLTEQMEDFLSNHRLMVLATYGRGELIVNDPERLEL